MRRLFIAGSITDEVTVSGAEAKHIMFSLRAKAGDTFSVAGEGGRLAEMEAVAFTPGSVTLRFLHWQENACESPCRISLAVCLPKFDKMDFIVQKAVELGAHGIVPLKSTNSVVSYDEKKCAARQERWQRIAHEAAKQCGRAAVPKVCPVQGLEPWLLGTRQNDKDTPIIFCYEGEQEKPLRDYLRSAPPEKAILLIGPEGGFTSAEAALLEKNGAASVSLGPRILRTETAALAALTIIQYEGGDLGV